MAIVKWEPGGNVSTLQERINRLFEDAYPRYGDTGDTLSLCAWRPLVDIYKTEEGLTVLAELPGVKKEDVTVEVKENVLTLQGERTEDAQIPPDHYYRRERSFGTFERSFNLDYPVNPENVTASFKDGVLKVTVTRPEKKKSRRITVNID